MARTLDYQKVATFWKTSTEQAKEKLDYVAAQDKMIPLSVQVKLRDAQMKFFREQVMPHVSKEARVLDLGCGPGVWALELAPSVGHVTGIDIAPAFIEYAQKEAQKRGIQNVSFEVASFLDFDPLRPSSSGKARASLAPSEARPGDPSEKDPQMDSPVKPGNDEKDHKFDLILLGAMLVHVDDPELLPLLQKVRESLAPGGIVYVRSSLAPRTRYARTSSYQALYRTKVEYERAFAEAGFTFTQERDTVYTDASLAAVYFGAANIATLGLARRDSIGGRLFQWLEDKRSITFDGARFLLDKTPTPICYHFILRARA